ncbi:MAG TPA: glycosyltransferase family 4 protein, partial [Bacteroidia bacterium]|nr:glycosyltransferase family 4 protein [Bacteroidia bacterium]
FPEVPTYWLPNGVDLNFYDPSKIKDSDWREKQGFRKDDLLFLYAGILGLAQGLEVILYAADKLKQHQQIKFLIMGSGPEKDKLLILRDKLGLKNVFFLDAVTKSEMPGILRVVDASVIPLRRLDLFLGAIPSKIFECLAMELPVLLGVDGEARELFVKQGRCALYFEPEDAGALANAVLTFSGDEHLREQLGRQGRIYVNEKFNRETIASAFYARIQSL